LPFNNKEFLPSTIPIGAKPPSSAGDQKGAGYLSDRFFSNYCAKEMPVNIGQTMERGISVDNCSAGGGSKISENTVNSAYRATIMNGYQSRRDLSGF